MSMQRGKVVLRVWSQLAERRNVSYFLNNRHTSFLSRLFLPARHLSLSTRLMAYKTIERGSLNTQDYRVFFTDAEGIPVSPFHDIPLYSDVENKIFNMVVEIPRWTNAKMEINKEEELNPIKQDVKKGAVRFVKNCFPHHGYIWNYGAFPQTWEDPDHEEPTTGTKGDCDPLDICEIGQMVHKRGAVIQVKVLGIMCLVDEGETDWKVLCIDVNDPLAEQLNDIEDIEKHMPGFIKATREWFTIYKIPDGKPANKFAYNGEAKNREFALRIIGECHDQWKKLIGPEEANRGQISCKTCKVFDSPHRIDATAASEIVGKAAPFGQPAHQPDDVDKWYYIPASALSTDAQSQL